MAKGKIIDFTAYRAQHMTNQPSKIEDHLSEDLGTAISDLIRRLRDGQSLKQANHAEYPLKNTVHS